MAGIANQTPGSMSSSSASDLYNAQRATTGQTIADILAQGDALKGSLGAGGYSSIYSGGTPGHYVDNTGAVNAQYNGIRDDTGHLYDMATQQILAQAPQIQSDAGARINLLTSLGAQGNASAAGRAIQQQGDQSNWITALGLNATPQMQRATGIANALQNSRDAFSKLNSDYFGALRDVALSRNQAQAGAFTDANKQQQAKIEAARQAALAKAIYYVGGSRGHLVSSASSQKAADKKLASSITKEQKAITSAQKKDDAQRAKDPTIRQQAIQANRRLT